jgi:hypothetical protein
VSFLRGSGRGEPRPLPISKGRKVRDGIIYSHVPDHRLSGGKLRHPTAPPPTRSDAPDAGSPAVVGPGKYTLTRERVGLSGRGWHKLVERGRIVYKTSVRPRSASGPDEGQRALDRIMDAQAEAARRAHERWRQRHR